MLMTEFKDLATLEADQDKREAVANKALTCLIHIFEDNKGLLCYKHVV